MSKNNNNNSNSNNNSDFLKVVNDIITELNDDALNLNLPVFKSKIDSLDALTFSGGGIKGISYIGCLKYLEEINIINNFNSFAGCSVGSIIAFFIILGFSSDELTEFFINFNFNKYVTTNIDTFFNDYGLNNGNAIMNILSLFLKHKNINENITFKQLFDLTHKKFIVATTNITNKSLELLDYLSYPDLPVILGIRMSISIPFIFTPVIYNNCFYVDGSCKKDIVVDFHDHSKLLAFYISNQPSNDINDIVSYFNSILNSTFDNVSDSSHDLNLVNIIIDNLPLYDFNLTPDVIYNLINIGYISTKKFFIS